MLQNSLAGDTEAEVVALVPYSTEARKYAGTVASFSK